VCGNYSSGLAHCYADLNNCGAQRLKSNTASGRMAAESKDADKVYTEQQNIKSDDKQIAIDKAALTADQKR
jgi:hypothetical protein